MLSALALCSCRHEDDPPPSDDSQAVALLKRSMGVYGNMKAFHAICAYDLKLGGHTAPQQTREIDYAAPNKFKVVSRDAGLVQTAVCDGKAEVDSDNLGWALGQRSAAPASICAADSVLMSQPTLCGSLLYQFFGGTANYANVVDEARGPVMFGAEETAPGGEKARTVKFFGQKLYGNVDVLIGERSFFVFRIRYDNAPIAKRLTDLGFVPTNTPARAGGSAPAVRLPDMRSMATQETFTDVIATDSMPPGAFRIPRLKSR